MTVHALGDGGRCARCGKFPLLGDGGYCTGLNLQNLPPQSEEGDRIRELFQKPTEWPKLAERLYQRFGEGLWQEGMLLLDENARPYRILSVWLSDLQLAANDVLYSVNVEKLGVWVWTWTEWGIGQADEGPPLLLDLRDRGTGGILLDRCGLGPDDRLCVLAGCWQLHRAGGRTYVGATLGEVAAKWLLDVNVTPERIVDSLSTITIAHDSILVEAPPTWEKLNADVEAFKAAVRDWRRL